MFAARAPPAAASGPVSSLRYSLQPATGTSSHPEEAANRGFSRAGGFPVRRFCSIAAAMTRFTVNGQPVHYRIDPETPLLWALRDASNLTGTK